MKSFADIIEAFGSGVVAEILGLQDSHVRTMKARDSIPPEHWGRLVEEAPLRGVAGVDWKMLSDLRAKRFSREATEAAQ